MKIVNNKKINIHHLRVIEEFSQTSDVIVKDLEIFLIGYVSYQTARKIIAQMVELDLIYLEVNPADQRSKLVHFRVVDAHELL